MNATLSSTAVVSDCVHGFVCRLDEAVRRIAAGTSSSKSSAQKGRGEAEFGKNVSRNELVER